MTETETQDKDADASAHTTGPKAAPVTDVKDTFDFKKVVIAVAVVVLAVVVYAKYFM